jgi:hypothetical protein
MSIAFVQANWAYLEHRLGFVPQAQQRLTIALEADLALEEEFDQSLYQMHRIQLGHNLVRVEGRLGHFRESFILAGQLVAFMEGRRRDLPFHRNWYPDRLLGVSRDLIFSMIMQIGAEAIEFEVVHSKPEYWTCFSEALNLPDDESELRFLDPRLWRWLRAQTRERIESTEDYLAILEEVLPAGPRELGSIYYSLIVDFANFCAVDESLAAKKVHAAILRDSVKWKGVPPVLANHMATMAAMAA